MSNDTACTAAAATTGDRKQQQRKNEKRHLSIFDVPSEFFGSCRLLQSPCSLPEPPEPSPVTAAIEAPGDEEQPIVTAKSLVSRWSCNTCKGEFESLAEQRSHFKSDVHRFNVKLTIAGKDTMREEDFDELTSDSLFKDYDISSISGSEDEAEKGSFPPNYVNSGLSRSVKQKLFILLQKGERVSLWKSLLLDEAENIFFESDNMVGADDGGSIPCVREKEVIERLNLVIHEPRDNTRLRVVLLASGGHFAGCVFDGNSVVAHKTFHRYVIRAKAGKKQSSKDASGRAAHSAGASLRRYNELALKKEIQELLTAWKPYFDASLCVFVYAPSDNHQLLFDGEIPYFSCKHCVVRSVPLTVRRPTLKEARRVYNLLTQVTYEVDESSSIIKGDSVLSVSIANECFLGSTKEDVVIVDDLGGLKITEVSSGVKNSEILPISSESENEVGSAFTPLHEAAKSGSQLEVLELLEQGSDPCIVDERGRTPYMLATEKEVRNIFRRFMASNPDKWDWNAAKVPSALTKEMEESQAAKQAEKDAKRKARAKELKKLRKAKEKKAQADAASSKSAPTISANRVATPIALSKGQSQSSTGAQMSKEEEQKRAQALEREKRAAAAERRIAASHTTQETSASNVSSSSSQPKGMVTTDIKCSCCNSSLVGKVPFHRYNYKYCSTSCMHVHKEMLEDG